MKKISKANIFLYLLTSMLMINIVGSNQVLGQSGVTYYFEQGNQAYRNGDYKVALDWYKKIVQDGYESSQVYYNIGNCYYKLDQLGPTVLFYEKAKKLNPNDTEIESNLALANLKVVDRIEMPPAFFLFKWWENVTTMFSISQLANITIVLYIAVIIFICAFFFISASKGRRLLIYMLGVSGVFLLFFVYLLLSNIYTERKEKSAIVLTASINVLSAPDVNSTDVFVLHEGVKVLLDDQRGEWVKISLPDGKSGWMRQNFLGEI